MMRGVTVPGVFQQTFAAVSALTHHSGMIYNPKDCKKDAMNEGREDMY